MQVRRTEAAAASLPSGASRPAEAAKPTAGATPRTDRFQGHGARVVSEGDRLAQLKAAVEAARAGAQPEPTAKPNEPYQPADVFRPPYTGGAPALDAAEMDATLVNNNPELKLLYAIEDKAPWALKGYQLFTKVLGPLGAVFNLGYSALSAKRMLTDPKAPGFLKGASVASTALAGASAAAAVRVGLHAWNVWPMATQGAVLAGKVAGVAGLGAGAILSAMDTFNTFRNPKATPAEKGLSLIGTVASAALPVTILMGVGGPIGIGLGLAAIALPLLKGRLGKIPALNHVFSAAGHALAPVGKALGSVGRGIGYLLGKVF